MDSEHHILRVLGRERMARKESERILESKSLEIYEQKLEIETLRNKLDKEIQSKFSQINRTQLIQEEVFEAHPFSIFIFSLNSLKILSANNTAVEQYGYSKKEFLELSITDLHNAKEKEEVDRHVHNIKSGIYRAKTWTHVKRNGESISAKITGVTIEFDEEPARVVVVEDVTESMLLREKNEIQQKRYVNLIDKSSDLIFGVSSKGRFTFVNSVTCDLTGFSEEELLSMSFLDLIRDDYRKRVLSFYEFQLQSVTETTYTEFPIVSKNKEVNWLGQNVNVSENNSGGFELSAIARVITEKKVFEKALLRSEDKFRSIIENMELGLLETNREGLIVKAYKSFCKIVGYAPEELEGTDGKFMLDTEAMSLMDEQQRNRYVGQTGVYEIQLLCKDGSRKWVLISGAPFYDQNNRYTGSIGIHLDITERKRIEAELLSAKNVAESSLRAKEAFLANISHEIRTPLNAIIGLSEVLNKSQIDPENIQMIAQVSVASRNLLNLINDLLLLSKAEADGIKLKPAVYSIHEVISESASMFLNSAKDKNLNFDLNLNIDENIYHEFDRLRFEQVLQNLVSNAIKFTNEGSVKLSADYKGSKEEIEIKIEDTGIGIPEEELLTVFDGFIQGSNNNPEIFGGTGLGLSIVNNIVNLMDGKIVVSQLEKGTCFTLNLTIPVKENFQRTPTESFDYHISEIEGVKVLVAEDNLVNQALIKKILSDWNLEFTIVNNGKEAFEALRHENFDIVLMDIRMPVMNGLEATTLIRSKLNNYTTRIIALTANAPGDRNNEYWEVGFNDVLLKPFVQKDLLQLLIDNSSRNLERIKNGLMGYAQGDVEFAATLRSIFIEDSTRRVSDMKLASRSKKLNEISEISHSMKPSLAQLGSKDLNDLNQRLENQDINETEIESYVMIFELHIKLIIADLKKISF